jgi:hypothetical protein
MKKNQGQKTSRYCPFKVNVSSGYALSTIQDYGIEDIQDQKSGMSLLPSWKQVGLISIRRLDRSQLLSGDWIVLNSCSGVKLLSAAILW